MKRHLSRPSPALVVASLALIVAMGGTSYAAITLPKNSVGSKQIKKNAVTSSKIKKNAVTSSKVKDASLLAGDFKPGQLPQGPAGTPGAPGAPGAPGVAFGVLSYRTSGDVANPAGSQDFAEAVCDPGTFAVGGGAYGSGGIGQSLNSSYPSDGTGPAGSSGTAAWAVYMNNNSGADLTVTAFVICAPAGVVDGKAKLKAAAKK